GSIRYSLFANADRRDPMFIKPTVADLRVAAQSLGMNPSDEYLESAVRIVAPLAGAYAALDAMPDEVPTVTEPRTFSLPGADENPHGAWYVTTSIKRCDDGRLVGKRVALKDNVCLANVPMMIGASVLEGYVPEVDATVVTRVLEAGGEIAG